ncbi:choice-of-anchor D domain-containing protein [Corallibacter sp.]|uniref:choice-of-anchor D domain-containing protein n=1 Tax=Corallibacter sp. TaxID=2038084 RepID=UPI003AB6098D
MKKNYIILLIAFLCLTITGFGQIYTENFTGQNGKGAVGPTPTTDLTGVTWNIDISGASLTATTDWFRVQNEVFEARDIDGDGIWYSPSIDISAYTNVYFNLDAAERGTMEASDIFNTEYRINGGIWTSAATNGNLNDDFTSATVSQTGLNGNTLEIRVTMNNGAGSEYHTLDNILVDGTPASTNTTVAFSSATSTVTEDGLFFDVCVDITNEDSTATTVQLALDGASTATNGTDYDDGAGVPAAISFPQTLTFPANSVASQCFTFFISNDDAIIEGNETVILNLINPSGGDAAALGTITQHTVTITDNDLNDTCATAIPLTATSTCTYQTYSNVGATDSGIGSPGCSSLGPDVWFSVVVPSTGEITIDTNNIDFTDSGMALYSGTCGSLSLIECDDDDSPNGNMSLISRNDLTPGDTVYIRVWEYGGNVSGDFGICVTTPTPCTAPTNQPASLTFSNITHSSIDGSFTATTADEYLVVVSTSATLGANPVNGTTYSAGDTIGSGTVVQSSNATTFSATGLSQTTQYYFFVFAYNDSSCAGGPAYNTTTPLIGDETTITGPCLEEGFESGQPTDWANNDSYYNGGTANSGSQKAGMNDDNDWIRTEQLLSPSDLSFWARASGSTSSYTITIQYSSDNTTWLDHSQIIANGSNSGDITNSYQQFNVNLNLTGNYYIRWFMSARSGGSFYLDDVEVFCGTSTPTPELQLVDNTATNQNCGYTIDFGTQSVASNTDLTFDIENVGSADLDIASLNVTGDYTIVSPAAPFTVTSGNSQTVTVRFTPSTTGTQTGVLTINNNDSDEGSCTINLTGEGFTPAPDINVEGNLGTFPDIPGDASNTPAGFNNTLFAATTIGNSQTKSFRIVNEGTLNLTLSSITLGGSNPGDFTITGTAPANTIAPNGIEILEITFSPLASGTRTATVIINNNDGDENPFIFNIQGTGNCNTATYNIHPTEGPAGTVVTVTASSGSNPNDTTALYDGTTTTVTNISATSFEITIPDNAISADITFDDVTGCSRSLPFTVLDNDITSCEGSGTLPSDIFISEITDSDSSVNGHSYIELFNGTGANIDISSYFIEIHQNGGSSPSAYINIPNGTILANNSTYVISFGTGATEVDPVSQNNYFSPNTIGINDEDHLILNDGSNDIDLWGDTSGSPFTGGSGTEYNGSTPNGSNYTYRRKNSGITAPSMTWDSSEWDALTTTNYSDIGNYTFSVGTPPTITVEPTLPASNCNFTASISVTATEGYSGGNPLAYQWYYSAPGDTGWTIITNGTTYSGANSDTLNILDTLNLNNYQFYCQVRENLSTCYTASNAVKLNTAQAIWNGTNWSSLPTSSKVVIIDGDYNTSIGTNNETSFSACQLIVNAGNKLTITAGEYIEVINNVDVYGDGTNTDGILIEDKGSFIQRGNGAAAGTYTLHTNAITQVNKRTAPLNNWYEYTYWSSPVVGETIGNGLLEAHPTRRYWYNGQNYLDATAETNNNNGTVTGQDDIDDDGNDWQIANNGDIMLPGVGYAAMHNELGFGIPGANYEYTFEGALNTGDFSVPVYRNDSELNDNNWNFIGNPYPSAINADAFLLANTIVDQNVSESSGIIDGAIFFWSQNTGYSDSNNGNEVLNFAQSDYAVINGTGQTAGGDGVMPTRFIPSGQGFFISLSDAATTSVVSGTVRTADVVFQNSMRTINNNNQFFRTTNDPDKLWLNLTSNNGIFNQTLIGYVPGATSDYDGMYFDAPKNLSTDSYSSLYSIIGHDTITLQDKLAIQGKSPEDLNINEVIPLGFVTSINEATIYTISIEQLQGEFLTENTVYLKDNTLNVIHNLSESAYNFTSSIGEFNDRFEIVFTDTLLSIDENTVNDNGLTIIDNNGDTTFKVNAAYQIKRITLIDMLGREVFSATGNSNNETYNLSHLSQANYIAKVQLDNDYVITKKMVKK